MSDKNNGKEIYLYLILGKKEKLQTETKNDERVKKNINDSLWQVFNVHDLCNEKSTMHPEKNSLKHFLMILFTGREQSLVNFRQCIFEMHVKNEKQSVE